MKTIILTFLLCVSQTVFAQNITSALIGHAFSNDSTIAVYFNIHSTSTASTIPTSDIDVSLSDINANTTIPISNYSLISQVREYIGCDTSDFVWLHQYAAHVTLTDASYVALSNSCELRGELIVRNRLGGSTSSDANNKPMYVYDEFNICAKDLTNRNTHRTASNGIFYSCLNQPTYYSLHAFDIAEFDSLSFQLINPMIDRKTSTTYKTGMSAYKPLDVALTTQFTFDSLLGEFVYTPSDSNQNMASVAIKTTEWRKDVAGKYKKVGTSLREILFAIDVCPINTPPIIQGKTPIEVCEGEEICYVISTWEHNKTPPPPWPKPKADSVTIKWNRGIPDATFTVVDPKEIHQRARFCWRPKIGEASSLPYTFVVTARDDYCPTNGITSQAFSIYVTPKPEIQLQVSKLSDSSFRMQVEIPTAHDPNEYTTSMKIEAVDGSSLNSSIGGFISSKNLESDQRNDTLIMRKSQRFRVYTSVEGKSNDACKTEHYDTLNFHTAGINQVNKNTFTFYPNPTNGLIEFDKQMDATQIYNDLGQLLKSVDNTTVVDLSPLPPGVYTIVGSRSNEKFVGLVLKY